MGVHQGAQCDRASLAQNYYYNGFKFLYPEVNENFCGDGIVSVEMPLPSYLAAILFKLFGYNEQWFRLLTFFMLSIGMYALFLWLKMYVKPISALLLVFILNSSPILLFYATNFLPDVFSLGLVLIAWYLFFKQHIAHAYLPIEKKPFFQFIFVLTLSLSIAIKTTSAIQWCTMFGVLVMSCFSFLKIELLERKKLLFSLILATAIPIAWQLWSNHLGKLHRSEYFLMQIPLSENWAAFSEAFHIYWGNWPSETFALPIFYIAIGLLILIVFLKKWIHPNLYFLSIINTIGSLCFFGLMVQQFKYHDYYIICLLPMFVINWVALASIMSKIKSKYWWVKISFFIALILCFNFQYKIGKQSLESRYQKGNYWEQSQQDVEDYKIFKQKLNAVGINHSSHIAAGYDGAPNNMLYLLHLRGFRVQPKENPARMYNIVNACKPLILIVNDSNMLKDFEPYIKSATLKAEYKYLKAYEVGY